MAQTTAGSVPIPPAKKDDSEDVAWALSTAEAMYARGDRGDALKWLRRAAEAASEAEADDRALELAKAAADLAQLVGTTTSVPPPPPAQPSRPPPPPARASAPPPAVRPSAAPPPPPSRPGAPTKPVTSAPPPRMVGTAPKAAVKTPPAVTPVAPRTTEHRRAARRSRPDIEISRKSDETTQTQQDLALPLSQPKRRGRASRPAAEEVTPPVPEPAPPPSPASRPTPVPAPSDSGPIQTEDPEAWPTQSLSGREVPDDYQEKTRIGVPAYEASAKMATVATDVPSTPTLELGPLRTSQAIRVIVWRTHEGVHVAPHGTRVAAITIDAMLVGLDPGADLVAWLTGK